MFILILLLLFSEGREAEAWKPFKNTALLEVGYQWKNKQSNFALLLVFKGLSFTEKEMLM